MRYLIILLVFISIKSYGQCKDYIIGVNGDTLNCVDFNGKKQGRWVIKVESCKRRKGLRRGR